MQRQGPGHLGGARPAQGLGPVAQQKIREAFQTAQRDPAAGAAEFTRLAGIASERGMEGVAGHLCLQAARAWYRAGNEEEAVGSVESAIDFAAELRNRDKALRKFGKLVAEIREKGNTAAADRIAAMVSERLGAAPIAPPAAAAAQGTPAVLNRSQRRLLPTHCPTCGAPVSSGEVDFNDDGTADCRYCGVVVT